jgi:hypothetical protein
MMLSVPNIEGSERRVITIQILKCGLHPFKSDRIFNRFSLWKNGWQPKPKDPTDLANECESKKQI